jgi:L-alanine-DL-glutamate epimerase-like enolase superfamily enzyme
VLLTWNAIDLKLAGEFRTAVATRTDKQTLWVKLAHDGVEGWGEAVPMDTYGQTLESSAAALERMAAMLADGDPFEVEHLTTALLARFDDQRAAVCAVDGALHDWIGKRLGQPTARLLGLSTRCIPLTSYTIGIAEPARLADRVRAAASYPALKIKVGTPRDEENLAIIREAAPNKTIRVDANTAWTVDETIARLPMLARHGVELVEQPIKPGDARGLRRIREAGLRLGREAGRDDSICPLVADESCVRPADVIALNGCVDGINIKLSKCGGIREALRMIAQARACGMKIMLGCMIESSLGIAAALQLAPLVDWLDLDGHLLLAAEPFEGIGGACGRLRLGGGPGLGVRLKTSSE